MNLKFIDREAEMEFLDRKYKEGGFQLLVLYGRRRVGKTELITRFMAGKEGIYYLADKRGTQTNSKLFAKEAAIFFNDIEPVAENFDNVFEYIVKRSNNKKIVVAIDEFSYLVERDHSIPSVFQKITDSILKNSNIMLILCGSSISMMEKGVLSYKSPLYGRRTGDWKLNPLKHMDAMKFFPKYNLEDKLKSVLLLGGVPEYLIKFDDSLSIQDNIKNMVFKKGEFLYNEVNVILQEELRDPSTYLRILDSMSKGATKIVDIANKSYIDAKDLPKYINVLQKLGYVTKLHPVTEKKPKTKKTIYKITDNFFNFWFSFVSPYKSDLESGKLNSATENLTKNINHFLGRWFEGLCKEILSDIKLPFKPSKTGTWWGYIKCLSLERKEVEIDLVCLEENKKEAIFIECKWADLKEKEARKVLLELKEKSTFVEWERKKEYFGLIGKKVLGKERLRKDGFFVWDLKDLEDAIR